MEPSKLGFQRKGPEVNTPEAPPALGLLFAQFSFTTKWLHQCAYIHSLLACQDPEKES